MTRFTTNIKKKKENPQSDICVALLSAGMGSKIKSYEPRSLLKIDNDHLINHQIESINKAFKNPEIITVVGFHGNKIIKKFKNKIRIIENQLHDKTNSSESLRLAFNSTVSKNFMFIHGDIFFNPNCLNVDYNKSFIIIDTNNKMKDNEVGVTICDEKLSIMSYGLDVKWCQIAFITGREYKILNNIFQKFEEIDKKKLSFEVINLIIQAGGSFNCYEPENMDLFEIDRIKDIK